MLEDVAARDLELPRSELTILFTMSSSMANNNTINFEDRLDMLHVHIVGEVAFVGFVAVKSNCSITNVPNHAHLADLSDFVMGKVLKKFHFGKSRCPPPMDRFGFV